MPFLVAAPPRLAHPLTAGQLPLLVARRYQVSYQLKRATRCLGDVKYTFLAPCTRRFLTNELPVILAELWEEIGSAHDFLGIEMLAIRSLPATAWHLSFSSHLNCPGGHWVSCLVISGYQQALEQSRQVRPGGIFAPTCFGSATRCAQVAPWLGRLLMHDALLFLIRHLITLTATEEDLVRQWFVPEAVPKGGFFLRPGEVSRKVGFVLQGVFHNFQSRDGQELTYYFGREREFIGEYSSFLPARPAGRGIQALEDAHLLTISYDNLQRFYREVRAGERFGRLIAEALFVDVLDQLTSFYEETPEQRYTRFVRTYPDLQQRIPQYYIASYVGVKPQSLSRIRGRAAR